MSQNALAGKPAPASMLVDLPRLMTAYFARRPDPTVAAERVAFGTSGHRGVSTAGSFNEWHILAVTQAVCDYRKSAGIDGPLFIGFDTHALSQAAFASAMEVLAANGVEARYQEGLGYTPTPAISFAILTYNRGRAHGLADGIVITPSHNPPDSGGFKYNPPNGGPADTDVTKGVERRANELLAAELAGVKRIPYGRAMAASTSQAHDFVEPYVADLPAVIDLEAIRASGLRLGVDPMGGASLPYWERIAERHRLPLTLVNQRVDATFSFMRVDHDGKIRMDCSSPSAMAGLVELRDRFDLAFGNDADADRHGIVTSDGLMNPNHFLCAAIEHLFSTRAGWPKAAGIGKTLVSSSLIDRIAGKLSRKLVEVPVGFKWFVAGLLDGSLGFGGEESAGASFLRMDGSPWSTDKDGLILDLLAAELMAKRGKSPSALYAELTRAHGAPLYARIDAPIAPEAKAKLSNLSPEQLDVSTLAGEPITQRLTKAPGNGASIGGIKLCTANGWFAARPSGTEDLYKIYAESFLGAEHLAALQREAKAIVDRVL